MWLFKKVDDKHVDVKVGNARVNALSHKAKWKILLKATLFRMTSKYTKEGF